MLCLCLRLRLRLSSLLVLGRLGEMSNAGPVALCLEASISRGRAWRVVS